MAALERVTVVESTAVPFDAEIQSGGAWWNGDHQEGLNFYITQIEELCADQTSVVSNGQSDDIVMSLHCSKVLSEHMGMSTKILSLLQLKERSFFTTPLIIKDDICIGNTRQFDLFYEYSNNDCEVAPVEIEEESSMVGIIKELGYGSTVDTTHCKDLLSLFLPLNEVILSKFVGTIVRTPTGLEDTKSEHLKFCSALDIRLIDPSLLTTWNIDVLVESIKLLAPETNWTNVMENLDHEEFNIADEKAFSLLMSIYVKACQDPFPLHAICGSVWNNAEGQLSFLRHAVVASPDIFTFAHCSRKTYMDKLPSNEHGNQAWSCLDLLEVLCLLAERGFVSSVQLMLEYPINHCPVVLLVGIAQINTAYNLLQHEVASIIFPTILKDSAESSIVQHLWHVNKNLVLRGFLDAHMDPNSIFQILNISQELKPSESSLQLMSSSSQFAQQLSPFQLQQRHQSLLGNGLKTTVTSANYAKTVSSHAGKSSLVCAPVDSVICQQANVSQPLRTRSSQQSASLTSALSFSHGFLHPSLSITTTGFGLALNIETLVTAAERRDTPIENPAPEVQDKILFMINNISNANIDTKAKEFIEVLQEQYYPWFAQYMVMRRASIEPNFHDLYLKFLDKVNHKSLNKEILKATYENCKVLLRSDLIKSSSEERSLLKNLGSLLGKLTIGRNQTLRAMELDPKVLIVEAYEKGLMIAVIPFTSKILEPCRCSIVYQPPNPWTMGILGLLTEIYNLPNLKMNLKFDIEVLFKNLSVDMKDAKPSSLLKDRVRELEGNPDFSCKDVTAPQPPVLPDANSGIMPTLNQVELQRDVNNISHLSSHANYSAFLRLASNAMVGDGDVEALIIPESIQSTQNLSLFTPSDTPSCASQLLTIIPNSDYSVNINQKLSSMYPKMDFDRIVQVALGQAIKDMVPRVLHLVSLACKTTKELVWKDYAMELDYSVTHRAARSMVEFLAANMAHVNCKEPLRDALLNHLQSVFQTLNVNKECSKQFVQILTSDHLDLGGEVIINIALKKAVELIDGELDSFFASMRKQIELAGYAYYVAGTYAQGRFAHLPEALRPNPGHLPMAQQRVYDDFNRNLWKPSHNSDVVPADPHGINSSSVSSAASHVYGSSTGQLSSSIFPTSHVAPGVSAVPRQLDLVLEDHISGSTQLLSVPSTHVFINGVMKPNAEISSTTATSAAVSFAESHVMEEVGAGLPSSTWSEHLGIAMPGSLLRPGDALDKYGQLEKKVCLWFDNWLEICENPNVNIAACSHISQLQQNGWLKGDDVTDQIFHILTVHSVGRCVAIEHATNPDSLSLQSTQQRQLSFSAIDAYAKLVIFVLKHCLVDQESSEPILLSKILSVTVRVIQKEAKDKTTSFNPRPYFRLFINWLLDLTSPDPALNGANFQVLTLFANAFHALQPLKVPGWSFAWLELLSHRSFMPKLLTANTKEGWRWFHCLLVDLFKFMQPYLRSTHKIGEPVQFFYKGTLKVLLVLLHDFPEFLCEYHFSFCDLIPPHCIQMRNIILSSFPCNMRVPNPSEPNLKIDLLPETSQSPCILSDVDGALKAKQIKVDIDEFLKTRLEEPFLSELMQRLLLPQSEASLIGTYYNVPLINSLVLYVGMQAIQQLESTPTPLRDILQVRAPLDIFERMVDRLDSEGRYHFLNAVANQLRWPNSHTHYFCFILLHLFARGSQEMVREQITRVLLERLVISRPHPWGLKIAFIELIKNPEYEFWSQPFIRCTQGIEKLLHAAAAHVFSGLKTVKEDGIAAIELTGGND